MTKKFLNPYNFVPAFPRERLPEELRDAPPPGHDLLRPEPDRWTGRIGVTLTVETPLLLPDTARPTPEHEPGHLVYPVRMRDGRPHLAQTGLKGMLRSAFEMVTNSRMGIFEEHGERLGYRRSAEEAQQVRPVVLAENRTVVLLEEAKLPSYPDEGQPVTYPDGSYPQHRDAVVAVIRNDRVLRLARRQDAGTLRGPEAANEKQVTGFLYITGRNIDGKKYERLFYKTENTKPRQLDEAQWDQLAAQWEALIQNYRDAHDLAEILHRQKDNGGGKARPTEWLGKEPGRTAWSPHLYEHHVEDPDRIKEDKYLPFRTALMCWARYEENRITALYPVKVSRDLYAYAPRDLVDDSLLPASTFEQLSPADRVFGWVAADASGRRPAAYRGRVRIGPVTCCQEAEQAVRSFPGDGMPLAILGKPKPEQGGFYLAESRARPDEPVGERTARSGLYKKPQTLRGRKTYPHHAGLPETYWEEPEGNGDPTQIPLDGVRFREFRRPRKPGQTGGDKQTAAEEQRDTQNRSIRGWVEPGTTFRFTIEVRDLDTVELGALAWLLSLPPGHFHRLGLGKPLGFGSVRLTVNPDNTELSSGEQWVSYYRSLNGPLPTADAEHTLKKAVETFTALGERSRALGTVLKTFLAAARGNPDLPVHYPRVSAPGQSPSAPTPPDPDGNSYAWFTENQRSGKNGIQPGRGRALPPLAPKARQLEIYEKGDPSTEEDGRKKKGNKGGAPRRSNRGSHQGRGHRGAGGHGRRR
ncbi:TIGR03986 family type III CRISPR-associated RAMP protein [Streptomyces marincola]|uniref:CRISPR-associated RAMP family protein n=1 Tax=Streptomyces marincola TaxID=2878388 RepID=A0A1W7D4J3_9ACTN|nr:TIGR03986 family CRISPR-associated RAMP protein [Streptomyces marincola]ARQ71932.1 CRISPR-associated RAMP family protein [Streptomyces marincola]